MASLWRWRASHNRYSGFIGLHSSRLSERDQHIDCGSLFLELELSNRCECLLGPFIIG